MILQQRNDSLHLLIPLKVSKAFFVTEKYILLMICKSGNFNATTAEDGDDILMKLQM